MILEIKRDKILKDVASYKCLAEKVLDEGIEVRAFTAKAFTLKTIKLHKVIDGQEHDKALQQQCEGKVATTAVQLWKARARTHLTLVQKTGESAN